VSGLRVVPGRLGVCRLDGAAGVPAWATGRLVSVTRAGAELSVVCDLEAVPPGVRCEGPWRALVVAGVLDLSMVGVLSSLSRALAGAGVPIFVVSTFDTDYVLVREGDLGRAIAALRGAGHGVDGAG
jgi:hypothetical protein